MPIEGGIRQDGTISSKLFTAYLEEISMNLNWENFMDRINDTCPNNLRFVDDIVFVSKSRVELQQMIKAQQRDTLN